jgi:hypothetical protein
MPRDGVQRTLCSFFLAGDTHHGRCLRSAVPHPAHVVVHNHVGRACRAHVGRLSGRRMGAYQGVERGAATQWLYWSDGDAAARWQDDGAAVGGAGWDQQSRAALQEAVRRQQQLCEQSCGGGAKLMQVLLLEKDSRGQDFFAKHVDKPTGIAGRWVGAVCTCLSFANKSSGG